jgi:hypothetical protein
MCYSWNDEVEKTAWNEVAQEDRPTTAPEPRAESRVGPERVRFWTLRFGRRDRTTHEAEAERTLEKV